MRLNVIQIKTHLSILVLLYLGSLARANDFIWESGYNGFFENREYHNSFDKSQTIFGSNTFLSAGFAINNNAFLMGANLNYEFGSLIDEESFSPIFYFQHTDKVINFKMGAFPKGELLDLPKFLMGDTVSFYKPNLEGLFLNFNYGLGSHNLWFDWTSKQSETRREIFQLGGTGKIEKGMFLYRHDFILTHYALSGIQNPDEHINDNAGAFLQIGFHIPAKPFDSLSISTGYCFSADRLRSIYNWQYSHGSMTQFYARIHDFSIRTLLYFGTGQEQYGGDPLYKAKSYQRIDLAWEFFNKNWLKGTVESGFHIIDGELDYSQTLKISAIIGGRKKIKSTVN